MKTNRPSLETGMHILAMAVIAARTAVTALLLVAMTGCETVEKYSLTHKLWSNERMRRFSEPTEPANLRLYRAPSVPGDILVQYDAVSEGSEKIQRRAYFLRANAARIGASQKPVFVDFKQSALLQPVPALEVTAANPTNAPELAFTVIKHYGNAAFVLYHNGMLQQTNELPVYCESAFTGGRVLLTPLAVAGDTVMVGLVASAVGFVMWAQAGGPFVSH